MSLPNIGLVGKARSGKDTVAARLISTKQYTRVSFADPLKDMALQIDPIIGAWTSFCDEYDHDSELIRLSAIVSDIGWERAKDEYPEVRRFLISLGQSVREQDEDFWLNLATRKIANAEAWNLPVVVTDVRFLNEANALRDAGFTLVRVSRPGTAEIDDVSETELDGFKCDEELYNCMSVSYLHTLVDKLTA